MGPFCPQVMSALHFLLMAVSLPMVVVMSQQLDYPGPSPPEGFPISGNFTDLSDMEAYCQMLLLSPIHPDEIPWFCMCTKCKSNPGPKGDRGDRGLPGRTLTKTHACGQSYPAGPICTQ